VFEIGHSLREARERQGLGYPEIELATKIRAKHIRALEEENFTGIAGDAYIRGFLRTYAEYLGLDGQLYVEEYASRFGTSIDEAPSARPPRPRRDRGIERRAVLLALLGIATLTALVFAAWRYGGGDPGRSTPPVLRTQTQQRQPAAATELVLRGVGKGTYVEVRRSSARGKVVLQATVPGGGVEKLQGSRFYLYVRRPLRLRVRLGGKAVSLPGGTNLRVLVTPQRTTRLRG